VTTSNEKLVGEKKSQWGAIMGEEGVTPLFGVSTVENAKLQRMVYWGKFATFKDPIR